MYDFSRDWLFFPVGRAVRVLMALAEEERGVRDASVVEDR